PPRPSRSPPSPRYALTRSPGRTYDSGEDLCGPYATGSGPTPCSRAAAASALPRRECSRMAHTYSKEEGMRPAMLLFVTLAIGLGSTACTTGRPQPLDRLYTPPILSQAGVNCSAVNASPSPVLMAVGILSVQGARVPSSTPRVTPS